MKIISGGQTGADLGGLRAARRVGFITGGWAPKGYLTERGPLPYLLKSYGLREHWSATYPPRTIENIRDANMTLIFAEKMDKGSAFTRDICFKLHKPVFHISSVDYNATDLDLLRSISDVWKWIETRPHHIINIAGNRESRSPGIGVKTTYFLIKLFEAMK